MSNFEYFPRAHTALAEWLVCVAFICPLSLREIHIKQLAVALPFLASMLFTFILMENLNAQGLLWAVLMALGAAQMLLLIFLKNRPDWAKTLYRWARAFLVAELAASLEWQINYYLFQNAVISSVEQTYICMGIVYALIFVIIILHRKKARNLFTGRLSMREAFSAAGIALGAFVISNIQFALSDSFFLISMNEGVLSARTMVDLGGVVMLYANSEQRRQMYLRYEFDAMANLLQRQYEQYQQLESNNEALRNVYHDLKHQISYLEAETNIDRRSAHLTELKEIIRTNESKVHTGSSVLDTILTGKSLICAEEGITMTCYADAQHIGFISVMDICGIFGNIIDNAIEYERKVDSPDQRLIKVYVSKRGAFLLIRVENFCDETVEFKAGMPVTTKADKQLHGLGLKNVQRSVERYGGHINFEQADGWFTVTILIPLPRTE